MIDVVDLLELESLITQVSTREYSDALIKVLRHPDLPPRGMKGDPVNVERMELVLLWVIEELRKVVAHKGS